MKKPINVIPRLSSSLGRKDEVPNQELAQEIAQSNDENAVSELVENLSNKKPIQNDCIKVLYEIGRIEPSLIKGYLNTFLELLNSKNNRLQWGGMIAIGTIVAEVAAAVYEALPAILDASGKGSVITKDHAFNILLELAQTKGYEEGAIPLILEQLIQSPTNQLPMYAEKLMPIVTEKNKEDFSKVLNGRIEDIEQESKKKRIEKVLGKISKV